MPAGYADNTRPEGLISVGCLTDEGSPCRRRVSALCVAMAPFT